MTSSPISRQPRVTFYGGARAVSGSMHLLEAHGCRVLLDCGLVLGPSSLAQERNRTFPFAPETIDAVLLSHAHVDHCGNLPNLVRQGFQGPIYCTPATRDLLGIMLADSARIQEREASVHAFVSNRVDENSTGLLYSGREVERTLNQCRARVYDKLFEIGADLQARFHDAGHLLGSAMIEVICQTESGPRTITYTGDLGRPVMNFLHAPAPLPASDLIICESTYGGRTHQSMPDLLDTLREVVLRTIDRAGKVLIPSFSLGRAQLVVHYLQRGMQQGLLPRVPIFVDSPLAADIALVHRQHPTNLSADARASLPSEMEGDDVHYIRSREESRDLSKRRGPFVLVASGGMCDAGRIIPHLEQNLDDPRCSVVLVSYQAPGSLGRKLLERGPSVRYKNRVLNKWADVVDLNGFSGHADQRDFLNHFRPLLSRRPRIRLVHGDLEQSNALANALRAEGFDEVGIPQREDRVLVA